MFELNITEFKMNELHDLRDFSDALVANSSVKWGMGGGAVSTYQGLQAFSSNGLKIDSTLCDPEKCLRKIESILPTTVGLIEPEGLCVDEYGVMYSIQQTVSNSSMTSTDKNFWLFEEYSDSVDAVD